MHIGFLSYRIAGLDGVSLEADRWKTMLERMGHQVTFVAGKLDRQGVLVPGFHYTDPRIYPIHQELLTNQEINFQKAKKTLSKVAKELEKELRELFNKLRFDCLIVANVFSLPMHPSAAIALDRVIREFKITTFSRNHDFWWERKRYHRPNWSKFFQRHFPPAKNSFVAHITINSLAKKALKRHAGIDSMVIGDSFDFNAPWPKKNSYLKHWRKNFDIKPKEIVFLQATRIVPRKQIELSIELVTRLENPKIILLIGSHTEDEGSEYLGHLHYIVKQSNARVKFIGNRIGSRREIKNNQRIYTLWDCFLNCDLVTYPSESEGFGNQFIEAVYFKKPVFVNRYQVYKADLEPLGFETVAIDGKITPETIRQTKKILSDPKQRKKMVEKNFKIAKKHFSFEATQKKLTQLGF